MFRTVACSLLRQIVHVLCQSLIFEYTTNFEKILLPRKIVKKIKSPSAKGQRDGNCLASPNKNQWNQIIVVIQNTYKL